MSVSDPLIKDVKSCVQQFLNLNFTSTPITDNNFYFILFCQTLEKIFNKGLIRQQNTKYFNRIIDPYAWMVSISREKGTTILTYRNCVDCVREKKEIYSNEGRFRYLVKICLLKKCLQVSLECLIDSQIAHLLYSPNSILGDEILIEIFLSVIRQVSKIEFSLDLNNCSFLDYSWYIPEILTIELVPCKALGVTVSFSGNKAVIVNVESNGVVGESNKVKLGDVLDSLNGVHIDSSCKGKLSSIMRSNRNKPIIMKVAKINFEGSGEIYKPIEQLIKDMKLNLDLKKSENSISSTRVNSDKKMNIYGYHVKYLAEVDVGTLGNVKQVQKAIKCILDNHVNDVKSVSRIDKDVSFEIGEIALKIRDKISGEMILDHPYMKISACGNLPLHPTIFGYCAGKENCDVAKEFHCHLFESSFDDADTILQSIGQGFHRTHYAV
ncbi:uncharacterized protein LOC115887654 isoform X1 [Sitophilus oryzae]|uniref:Uncharacterized protein LOC115887654 isoform X1 n=1 Tax=Sitophilus oryzae TaxID=7048 RepID=A0A6J2YJD4_SITOR|nr:uncharacterized protein LOC115887654 isoform X1 [Sitophilus oryzae]